MTAARELARVTKEFAFKDLPPQVIHHTKRLLIDALGCCLGAFDADAPRIVRRVVEELGGPKESTIIGTGLKTHCLYATLANGIMVRYLDYNDLYAVPAGKCLRKLENHWVIVALNFSGQPQTVNIPNTLERRRGWKLLISNQRAIGPELLSGNFTLKPYEAMVIHNKE